MKLLSQYIIKQLVIGFVLVSVGMMAIVWLAQSFKMIDLFVTKGLSVWLFLKLTLVALPNFLAVISPLAFFAVVLFVYNRMLLDRELVVMQAVGMSPAQLSAPVLSTAFLLVLLGFCLTLKIVPDSVTAFRELQWTVRNDFSHVLLQEGEFNYLSKGYTVYIRERGRDGTLHGIMVYDNSSPQIKAAVFAEKGILMQGKGVTQIMMVNGSRQELKLTTKNFSVLYFDKYTMDFSEALANSKARSAEDKELTLTELLKAKKTDAGLNEEDYRSYKVEAFKRISQPFYNLIFVLVAMAGLLSGTYDRRGQTKKIVGIVAIVLLLQSAALGFENLSNKNLSYLSLMFLNLLIPLGVCLYLLLRKKEKKNVFLCVFSWIKEKIFKPLPFFKRFLTVVAVAFFFLLSGMKDGVCLMPATAPSVSKTAPVDFESDEVIYNKEKDEIIAVGNVEVRQEGTLLKADKITYNRKTTEVKALGNVMISQPDGSLFFAQSAVLDTSLKEGVVSSFSYMMADGSQVWADGGTREENGNIIRVKEGYFSPCDFCVNSAPLWDLHAKELIHNDEEMEFTQKHSFLEVKGVPVMYWPYLQYPDFRVKRKTGFLAPIMKKSQAMDISFGLPFFWVLSDNQDLELVPYFATNEHDPLLFSKYRGVFSSAELQLEGSITKDEKTSERNHASVGHIKGFLNYHIDENWCFRSNVYLTNSDTYFRRYKIQGTDETLSWLQNDMSFERFSTDSYLSVTALAFQNLRAGVQDSSMPYVAPLVDFSYKSQPIYANAYMTTDIHSSVITRKNNNDSRMISFAQAVNLPYVGAFGEIVNFQGQLRYDAFSVDNSDYSGYIGRFYPTASVEIKYPLINQGDTISQVIEPVAKLVVSPSSKENDDIPNEDSLDTEFDDSNLFATSRFTGYDKVEYGSHVAYGVKWTLYAPHNSTISTFLGQSYQFSKSDVFPERTGLKPYFSDYVGRVNVSYRDLSLAYRFRLDYKDFTPQTSEVNFHYGRDPLRIGIDYMFLKQSDYFYSDFPDREEVLFSLNSKLTKDWSVYYYYRYAFGSDGGPVETGGTLQYEDECLQVAFEVEKSYTKDRDYKGDLSFVLRFNLKMLGNFE
jgi:LPS-assembly protein